MTSLLEAHMDLMKPEHLDQLIEMDRGPCISIYMPTHRVWNETPQDRIRFKNLIQEAENLLIEGGMRRREARGMLEDARNLQQDDRFWQTQCDGLAVFISEGYLKPYRLPARFDEFVAVADRFHIKPLLQLLSGDGRYFVLALSLDNVRLLAGSHFSLVEMALSDTPSSLQEALKYDEFDTQQQFHSHTTGTTGGGDRAAMFHGQGGATDDANIKKRITQFFMMVDNGVCKQLAEQKAPLVLAGLDHLRGLYRTANHYEHMANVSVDVNPDDLSLDELHSRVWSLVEPRFQGVVEDARSTYESLAANNPERVSDQLDQVVSAAHYQRVDVLFAAEDAHWWGVFDPENGSIEAHREAEPGDQDLLDLAVAQTIRNAGTVYITERDEVPGESVLAAIFRY